MPTSRTLSTKEFAEHYGIGIHTALNLIYSGSVAAVNVAVNPNGRPKWRISAEAMAAFEASRAAQPKRVGTRRRKGGTVDAGRELRERFGI